MLSLEVFIMSRRRRAFSSEYKAEVVKLIRDSGKSIGQVAQELDLTESAVRNWVRQAEMDEWRGVCWSLNHR